MPRSKKTPGVLDAIRQALATFDALPDTPEAWKLRDECLVMEATAREWSRVPPSAEEREAMMRRVLALHIAITKLRRKTDSAPSDGEPE